MFRESSAFLERHIPGDKPSAFAFCAFQSSCLPSSIGAIWQGCFGQDLLESGLTEVNGVGAKIIHASIRSSHTTWAVLESNSTFMRMRFMLRVESCTNDRHANPVSGGVALNSARLESGPNANVRRGRSRVFCVNWKTSTESGMTIKPDNTGGRSSNSRRCDGGENVNLTSDWQLSKARRPTNSTDDGRTIELSE
jgi:hypothetical protein